MKLERNESVTCSLDINGFTNLRRKFVLLMFINEAHYS